MLDKESVLVLKKRLGVALPQMKAALMQLEIKQADLIQQIAKTEGAIGCCDELLKQEAVEAVEVPVEK